MMSDHLGPDEWVCPVCNTAKDQESKMQSHVWSKAGQDGHPDEETQKLWYPERARQKRRKSGWE